MFIFSNKWWYRLAFFIALLVVFHLLYSPFLAQFFYPLPFRQEIYYYSRQHQLDPHLVAAVIKVESGFQPEATSSEEARGLMQLMPYTGEWVAQMNGFDDFEVDMLYEPSYNLHLGTWYLAYLLDNFDYNLAQALAAYNGGQGQVRRWIEQDIWDGNGGNLEDIPFRETREYVRKVKRAYFRYEQIYGSENGKEHFVILPQEIRNIMEQVFH